MFQSVREVFSLELASEPLQAGSRLVVIGRGLDPLEYQAAFGALKVR